MHNTEIQVIICMISCYILLLARETMRLSDKVNVW